VIGHDLARDEASERDEHRFRKRDLALDRSCLVQDIEHLSIIRH